MTGVPLLLTFAAAIVLMVLAIAKWKVHPFLAILAISLLLAIVAGINIADIPGVIGAGFSGIFVSIGIVIILGGLIGKILEKTGAALKMADVMIRLVGKKNPDAAMFLMGMIIAIPVFCTSGFVILNPVRKALIKRTGKTGAGCTVALAMGLYITHCLLPPAPGPLAAVQALYGGMGFEVNLLMAMGIGAASAILPALTAFAYVRFIDGRIPCHSDETPEEAAQTYEQLVASYGRLPNALLSFAPIVLPIVLIGLSSALSMAPAVPDVLVFLGKPIIALTVGLLMGIVLLWQTGKLSGFHQLTDEALHAIGPILLVTAAGNVLGTVIGATNLVSYIKSNAASLQPLGLLFPFLLCMLIKVAQGSSTVAITTTVGILLPLMPALGFVTPVDVALVVTAVCAGSLTVSHPNDSYFWVIIHFGGVEARHAYIAHTLPTLLMGLAALLNVFILSALL